MPTLEIQGGTTNNDVWKDLLLGGEAVKTRTGKGVMASGVIYMKTGVFKNLDAKINRAVLRVYPKSSRSNQNLYPITLAYRIKISGGAYKKGSDTVWEKDSRKFPTSYPASPWTFDIGTWTLEEMQQGISLAIQMNLGGAGYLPTDGYLKGLDILVDYTLNTYTVSVATNGNGSVTGGGSGLTKGQAINISATPAEGYVFAYWSDGDRNPSRTITVSGNATYTATFVPKLSVERSTYIQNGVDGYYVYAYVTDAGNGINRVQFPTWTNENGQDDLLLDWSTNSAASGAKGTWTIGGLVYNYSYYVKVSEHNYEYLGYNTHIYPYDESNNQGKAGGVSLNMRFTVDTQASPVEGGTVTSATTVDWGTQVTLVATPNKNYNFLYWINNNGEIVSNNTSFTAEVKQDILYTAVFKKIMPKIVSVFLEKDNTLNGVIMGESVNIIVKVEETI